MERGTVKGTHFFVGFSVRSKCSGSFVPYALPCFGREESGKHMHSAQTNENSTHNNIFYIIHTYHLSCIYISVHLYCIQPNLSSLLIQALSILLLYCQDEGKYYSLKREIPVPRSGMLQRSYKEENHLFTFGVQDLYVFLKLNIKGFVEG